MTFDPFETAASARVVRKPRGIPIGMSKDLERILDLPRRSLDVDDPTAARTWTQALRRERTSCDCVARYGFCIKDLLPIQGWALEEISRQKGMLGPIGVGHGKEGICILAPWAAASRVAVLMLPSNLKAQFVTRDLPQWSEHFHVPSLAGGMFYTGRPILHVISFAELSSPRFETTLGRIAPDLIIANEVQNVGRKDAARTKRFLRYFDQHRGTRLVAVSGTLSKKSIKDYCLAPETRVLRADLRWSTAKEVRVGDVLVGFDEHLRRCKTRRAVVCGTARLRQPRVRIITDRGSVVCSTLHQWVLCARPGTKVKYRRWECAGDLRIGDQLAYYVEPWTYRTDWLGGYLAGLLDGEGWVSRQNGQIGFAQKPGMVLAAYKSGLQQLGVPFTHSDHASGVHRVLASGENQHMRLLGMLQPVRLMAKARLSWEGKQPWGRNTKRATILAIEPLPEGEVIGIQTSTQTLIAEGFLTHNSHTARLALGDGSPLPHEWATVQEWASILDADAHERADSEERDVLAGELRRLCGRGGEVRSPREAFRVRLVETPGVVASKEGALDTTLTLSERKVGEIPAAVRYALVDLRHDWRRPDGEELVTGIEVAACARQLACGFYYRWKWIKGESVKQIEAWLEARAAWHRELRQRLKQATELMDSPFLLMQAAIRWHKGYVHIDKETGERQVIPPHARSGPLPTWESECWPAWRDIRKSCQPATEAVWIDKYLMEDAAAWATEAPGIVWYDFTCVGDVIAALSGAPRYGGGSKASEMILTEVGDRSIIASMDSHGVGKNLQRFSRNLIVNPPSDGAAWEQLLARTHRPGQKADEVVAEVYRHTVEMREALDTAVSRARYMKETLGQQQKLLYADYAFEMEA